MVLGMETILNKLNSKYANSEITRIANTGDIAGAAEMAAKMAMWGLWIELRNAAGLPSDDAARNEWLAADKARRASKFAKR